ncbi:MAG: Ribosomal large subunit pseudouridine synthase D [Candidatus Anoxychlamydiales bacterium]|nr:Ribosomal large subunit pseudouridine synthase D [Candidatus Anoxychlamydiales bacterium]
MTEQESITIALEDKICRLDKFLSEKFNTQSRAYFQYLIDTGFVLVNSKKIKKSFIPSVGDDIEIFFQAVEMCDLKPQNIPLEILYEDENILAINKPKGMVVHPAAGNWENTFVNALLYHCKDLINFEDKIRPGIVHRLDKDTTGVIIAAKTTKAHQRLIVQFQNREIIKKYLAICVNKPDNQIINAPIKRHPIKRKEMAVIDSGKEASTKIETLAYNDKLSLVQASPKTGRTHQIRVHLKHINTPILGDETYGSKSLNKKFNIYTHLLHAYSIEFMHPITNEKMKIVANIPDEFKKFIHKIS